MTKLAFLEFWPPQCNRIQLAATYYRRRLRRVIAAPPNNPPKQSARTVWPSSPSHGSAGRGQGENNCNDFRCEFFLLDKTHAATNADVHEKVIQKLRFSAFCHDFGGPRASRRQLRHLRLQNRRFRLEGLAKIDFSRKSFLMNSWLDFCYFRKALGAVFLVNGLLGLFMVYFWPTYGLLIAYLWIEWMY